MKVTLIAQTMGSPAFYDVMVGKDWFPSSHRDGEQLIEFAGRACYQSWHKPNPATADTADYIANVLAQRHFSVVEHSSVSFYIEDVSRSLTHELVRHRHFSYSQLSQRFVDMSGARPVVHPSVRGDNAAEDILHRGFIAALTHYDAMVEHLKTTRPDMERKQVREVARELLPNCTPTSLIVSGNLRSWLEFVEKRCSPAADAAIREVSLDILAKLKDELPSVFGQQVDVGAEQRAPQPEYLGQP